MMQPANRGMKHTAVWELNTPTINPDTAESEENWSTAIASDSKCRFIPGNTRDILDHDADLSVERIIAPGTLTINGSAPDKTIHRIASLTSKSGETIDGAFKIIQVVTRENKKGQVKLYTFFVERVT